MLENIKELWEKYQKNRYISVRNELVEYYLSLADIIAAGTWKNLKKNSITCIDDLRSVAAVAPIGCIENFKPELNYKFESYCGKIIYFKIMDYLRENGFKRKMTTKDTKIQVSSEVLDDESGVLPVLNANILNKIKIKNVKPAINECFSSNKRNRIIFKAYHLLEYPMKKVGKRLGLAESRISQLMPNLNKCFRDYCKSNFYMF